MFFIFLLAISAIAIAGSAAFFSVYGLANTFSGVFWSVVVMGASLEAGKLVAASYLYRYWYQTNLLLKSYLAAGIVALMLLTSGGIFGYLSSGYQADVLPLKQLETQITLLEDEKGRMLERKKDIDKQIAQLPNNFVSARIRLMREFQAEQKVVTDRIKSLDQEVLELKTKLIKTEAHIGPITYIAKAFNMQTDDATKWLVFLIIFAFDPMAVALTLAVNVALRRRDDELAAAAPRQPLAPAEPEVRVVEKIVEKIVEKPVEVIREVQVPVEKIVEVIKEVPAPVAPAPEPEPIPAPAPESDSELTSPRPYMSDLTPAEDTQLKRHIKAYPELWKSYIEGTSADEKIEKLLQHFRFLKDKKASGVTLDKEEAWEMVTIEEILKRKGFDVYLN